ncbi:hypothetical protein D3C86_1342480 [compost metagenome]
MGVYGSPLVQDLAGLGAQPGPPRKHPGVSPEHRRFMEERAAELRSLLQEGGLRVAAIRMLLYVSGAEGGLDERSFALIRKMRAEADNALTLQEFKDLTRDQALMMTLDSAAAIQAMPRLLEGSSAAEIRGTLDTMKGVLEAAEPLSDAARESLAEMERIFESAERRAQKREQAQAPAESPKRLRVAAAKHESPATSAAPARKVKDLVDAAADVPAKTAKPHPVAARKAAAGESATKVAARKAAAGKSATKATAKKPASRQPAKVKTS